MQDGRIVFGANVLAVFVALSDLHNSFSPLGAKTTQTVCGNANFIPSEIVLVRLTFLNRQTYLFLILYYCIVSHNHVY